MGSLMPTEMLFSKKASPAVAQMSLSRGWPHPLEARDVVSHFPSEVDSFFVVLVT